MEENQQLLDQLTEIIRAGHTQLSDIYPSAWTEANVIMTEPYPGPFRYNKTPYTREIIDRLHPSDPARIVAVMKGGQIGFSAGVIYSGIGWIIKEAAGNTFLTVGARDLIEKAMEKLDLVIDNAGLRDLIGPQVKRKKAQKSGDTSLKKEFAGGYVTVASADNHRAWRQVDLKYGFLDDFESVKSASKESGNTQKLIEQRFAAYADTMKLFLISTPERKENSNIEKAYLEGDQRKYMIPCPCCGEFINLEWSIDAEIDGEKIQAGMDWKLDENNQLIKETVGYICQKCGGKFDEKNKMEWLNLGYWQPTQKAKRDGYFSYHISSLYAYAGMYSWTHYVYNWLSANPPGQPAKQDELAAFYNLVLGLPYESASEAPTATAIMKNTRDYEIESIPEKLSMADGNGRIVLVTCAADMNGTIFNEAKGTVDDARIDYEVVAWSESGASYSVTHGSIGTFIPLEGNKKVKADREKWTYAENKERSVWPELLKVISKSYTTDTGRTLGIGSTALDTGHYTTYAYNFIDKVARTIRIRGVKGDKEDQYVRFTSNPVRFKPALERKDLYILTVGLFKDLLNDQMALNWTEGMGESQPSGFMNFPQAKDGKYSYPGYYQHYEAEQRQTIINKDTGTSSSLWKKKKSTNQNHFFDCRVYNIAIKEIFIKEIGKAMNIQNFSWVDWAKIAVKLIEKGGG